MSGLNTPDSTTKMFAEIGRAKVTTINGELLYLAREITIYSTYPG